MSRVAAIQELTSLTQWKHVDTKQNLNPPAGSHHGVVWECCIHTAWKVMNALVKEQVLTVKD